MGLKLKLRRLFSWRILGGCILAAAICLAPAQPFVQAAEQTQATVTNSPAGLKNQSEQELKQYANDKYWQDDYVAAEEAVDMLLERSSRSLERLDHECLERYMNKAVCLIHVERFDKANKILYKLLKASRQETGDNNGGMDEPDCLFFLAECHYKEGAYKTAEVLYEQALTMYRKLLPPLSADLGPCLDGLAGCLFRRKDYEGCVPIFREMVRINALNKGPNHLATAWSLLNLTYVLDQTGKSDEATPLFEKSVYIFRESNADRILASMSKEEIAGQTPEAVQARIRSYVFGNADRPELASGGTVFSELVKGINYSEKPPRRPFDFYNWRLKRTKITDAPGLVTMNPARPLKGLIICVHGLGLHHGTFQPFADQMAKRGYGVVAFDVRGFGSYRTNKGYDKVDLNNSVKDIGDILKLMRRDYPGKTIFLLGESMGGAIALQVAAAYPQYIDGLVCSVPSGNRFGATTTNIHVAMKLLAHKDRPFDIGSRIVKQATSREGLRQRWQSDPEARLTLSPLELLQFQRFMNQNLKAAARLDKLPVVIFQGYGDKLVKPEGTLSLYNALSTQDKDLVFVGHSEHLIFEEGQFKPSVLNGLYGWLSGHLRDTVPTDIL